jgi:POT family proton-dependent oligopeptide transporter
LTGPARGVAEGSAAQGEPHLAASAKAVSQDPTFFGHPIGLAYLLGAEAGWAFAYFGLQIMLTLYMTQTLLKPGHVEHVIGFGAYRRLLVRLYGPLSPTGIASETFGIATGLIYALPILGGFLADRWLGQRRAMVVGVLILVVAHVLLIGEPAFLISLALMIIGTGFVKTNLLGQIGRLYAPGDDRRSRAFGLWLIALNTGSMTTPLISGTLGESLGWRYGFAAMAVGMFLGAVSYIAGWRQMPKDMVQGRRTKERARRASVLKPGDGRIIGVIVVLVVLDAIWTGIYNQAFNVFPVWAEDHVERHIFGLLIPVTWFSTLDGLMTITGTVVAVRLWSWRTKPGSNANDIRRVSVGFALATAAFLVLTAGSLIGGVGKAPLILEVLFFILVDFAIPWIDTIIVTMISRDSPVAVTSTMLGIYYLGAAAGNYLTGALGGLSDHISIQTFWLMHAGIAAGVLIFLLLAGGALNRLLQRRPIPA